MNLKATYGHIMKPILIFLLILVVPGFFGGSYILDKLQFLTFTIVSLEKAAIADKAKNKRKISALKNKHKKELAKVESSYEDKEKKLKKSHEKEMTNLDKSQLKKEKTLKEGHKNKENKLKRSHKNDLAKLKTRERAKAKVQRAISAVPILGVAAFSIFESQEFNSWKAEHPDGTLEEYSKEIGEAVSQLLREEYSEYHEEYMRFLEIWESEQ